MTRIELHSRVQRLGSRKNAFEITRRPVYNWFYASNDALFPLIDSL